MMGKWVVKGLKSFHDKGRHFKNCITRPITSNLLGWLKGMHLLFINNPILSLARKIV